MNEHPRTGSIARKSGRSSLPSLAGPSASRPGRAPLAGPVTRRSGRVSQDGPVTRRSGRPFPRLERPSPLCPPHGAVLPGLYRVLPAFLACLALAFSACAHHPDALTPKGFEPARSTQASLEESFEPRRWAVVVGVDRYVDPTWSPLKFAVNDARTMAKVLGDRRYGEFSRVIALDTPERTTREAILFELKRLRQDLRRQDTLLLYFSGHGTLEFSPEGLPFYYLVASDTRSGRLWDTGIDLTDLLNFFEELKPQRKVAIFDSCFSGEGKSKVPAAVRARMAQAGADSWKRLSQSVEQSQAILMATRLGGVAHEDDRLEHGVFTHFILQALTDERSQADANSDGAVTAYETLDFARMRAVDFTRGQQPPEGFFRVTGKGEVYLAGTPDPRRTPVARVFAYGTRYADGLKLEMNGRTRGAFPRTLALEPGTQQLTIRDESGHRLADGRFTLLPGRSYELDEVIDVLNTKRWFGGLETGAALQVVGPGELLVGAGGGRLALLGGYQVRTGLLAGLGVTLELGWNPIPDGPWQAYTGQRVRNVLDLSSELVLQRGRGKLQVGLGWHTMAVLTPAVRVTSGQAMDGSPSGTTGSVSALGTIPALAAQGWFSLAGGPMLREGYRLNDRVMLTLKEKVALSLPALEAVPATGGLPAVGGSAINVQAIVTGGVEFGF